jgi:hypothetical protein
MIRWDGGCNRSVRLNECAEGMTMTYEQTRDDEQWAAHNRAISDFLAQYGGNGTGPARQHRTVFFFPGGMACQLWRSTTPYQDGVSQNFQYDIMWLTLKSLVAEDQLNLGMYVNGGTSRDLDDYIVIADGAVNCAGYTPHQEFITWCNDNGFDLFVFNWDWRRRLDEVVTYFLNRFLPSFRARVLAEGGWDPTDPVAGNFSMVGHSFGGMLVNTILRSGDPVAAQMSKAITVATPFYGYASQIHRWFEGQQDLNGLFGAHTDDMIRVITSLPGLYVLHFLDLVTYTQNQQGLANDPFSLVQYPSVDYSTGNNFDPWFQQTNPNNANLVRFPENMGFQTGELTYELGVFQQMASPMPANLAAKFYNIRGVQLDGDGNPLANTVGSVTVDWIDKNTFSSMNTSPIRDGPPVPGDDTQPAWTARLVTNAAERIRTVEATDVSHIFLMSHPGTLSQIASILQPQEAAMMMVVTRKMPPPQRATHEEAESFMTWLYANQERLRNLDESELLRKVPAVFRKRLGNIGIRIMDNLMKHPHLGGRAPASAPAEHAAYDDDGPPRWKSPAGSGKKAVKPSPRKPAKSTGGKAKAAGKAEKATKKIKRAAKKIKKLVKAKKAGRIATAGKSAGKSAKRTANKSKPAKAGKKSRRAKGNAGKK